MAFGVVRALDYITLALMVGGLVFLFFVWTTGIDRGRRQRAALGAGGGAFARRLRRLFAVAIMLGVLVSVLGVLLQGASAAGVSLWASLKGSIISNTLDSRFGTVWGLRAIDWILLGSMLLAARAMRRDAIPVLRAARTRRASSRRSAGPPQLLLVLLGIGSAYLLCTPALAGHASIESPTGRVLPLRRSPCGRGEHVGRRDRLPAACPAGRHAPTGGS